ncbi:hypothetical protein HaLaN_29712, partial [Haematococcus lacustris]
MPCAASRSTPVWLVLTLGILFFMSSQHKVAHAPLAPNVVYDDQGSVCGQDRSRVTFNASAGVDYLVVVEGYTPSSCGVPAINVTSGPPNIISVAPQLRTHSAPLLPWLTPHPGQNTTTYYLGHCTPIMVLSRHGWLQSNVVYDDDRHVCRPSHGSWSSRVTFTADAGVDYLVVVEGYFTTSCGVPAINVTSTLVQAPPNITPI